MFLEVMALHFEQYRALIMIASVWICVVAFIVISTRNAFGSMKTIFLICTTISVVMTVLAVIMPSTASLCSVGAIENPGVCRGVRP